MRSDKPDAGPMHTHECWMYAVKTSAKGVGAYCISQCADARRAAATKGDEDGESELDRDVVGEQGEHPPVRAGEV